MAVGNRRLMKAEDVNMGPFGERTQELASGGRTAVIVAVDGRAAGVIGIADAPRPTSAERGRRASGAWIEVVMLTGDNEATARRIAGGARVDHVIAEVLPGDKARRSLSCRRPARGLRWLATA